jgi:lipopolysaccharide cholinephosphotransferase
MTVASRTQLDLYGLRQRQLTLLDRFDDLCRGVGLTYYLWGGTLLGAVKFGGYIPWDDDLDVAMPRTDYERLVALADDQLPTDTTLFTTTRVSDYHLPYAKLGLNRTLLVDHGSHLDLPINIDIYPIDDSPSPRAPLRRSLRWLALQVLASSMGPIGRGWRRPIRGLARLVVRHVISRRRLAAAVDRFAALTAPSSPRVRVAVWHNNSQLHRAWFGDPIDINYEGRACPSPRGQEPVLAALYGPRWTEMPPEEKQVTHHVFEAYDQTA